MASLRIWVGKFCDGVIKGLGMHGIDYQKTS